MNSYRFTPAAENDLFDIWVHIAADNPGAADRVEADILQTCRRLANRPEWGHFRRDLTDKPVRFFPVRGTYLVVYDPVTAPLEIIRILHGARDATAELE